MTWQPLARFFMQQPFEPFTMVLANGREIHVNHPELAGVNAPDGIVFWQHPSGQIEVIDPALIVSVRTIYASNIADFSRNGTHE